MTLLWPRFPVIGHLNDLDSLLSEVARKGRQPQRLILTKRSKREELELILNLADTNGTEAERRGTNRWKRSSTSLIAQARI